MADATGTPTSPDSIPTYNTAADAPSGLGFNSAMAAIQTALSARVLKSLFTTAGDLIYATAASTLVRLGVGSAGQVLTVAGGVPTWAAPAAGAVTLIDDYTVAGSVLASYDTDVRIGVNALPQTYKHLKLVMTARLDGLGAGVDTQYNGDTGANYVSHQALATSAARADVANVAQTAMICSVTPGSSDTANRWSVTEVLIPNYASAVIRKLMSSTTHGYQQTSLYTGQFGGEWSGTAAIVRVKFRPNAGNFAIGSRFSLYGIS